MKYNFLILKIKNAGGCIQITNLHIVRCISCALTKMNYIIHNLVLYTRNTH